MEITEHDGYVVVSKSPPLLLKYGLLTNELLDDGLRRLPDLLSARFTSELFDERLSRLPVVLSGEFEMFNSTRIKFTYDGVWTKDHPTLLHTYMTLYVGDVPAKLFRADGAIKSREGRHYRWILIKGPTKLHPIYAAMAS